MKICGITSEEDALLAVAMGADAVGFIFAPSPRQIAPSIARDIVQRLPPEILTVGVFRDESSERVVEIVNGAGLRAAQLHGHETPDAARWIRGASAVRDPGLRRRRPSARPRRRLRRRRHPHRLASARIGHGVRLVAGRGGARWPAGHPGRRPHRRQRGRAIDRVHPWGVDVATGVEVDGGEPGQKDARKVKAFIDAARAAAPVDHHSESVAPYDWMRDEYR